MRKHVALQNLKMSFDGKMIFDERLVVHRVVDFIADVFGRPPLNAVHYARFLLLDDEVARNQRYIAYAPKFKCMEAR